ncbi:MAG: electron transfer flavoprotein subunit alpha/FixB family protein [Candidatus Neomarinimicrobiota bacterium]
MGTILAYLQTDDHKPTRNALETLRGGQLLAAETGHRLVGAVFGANPPPDQFNYSMDELISVEALELDRYTPEYFLAAMAQVVTAEKPDLLLAAHIYQARDWLPRLAGALGRPMIGDCIGYQVDDVITWVRQVFQGKINAEVTASDGLVIVSFQAGAYKLDELESGSPAIRNLPVDLSSVEAHIKPGESFQDAKVTVDLSRAERIVSVGRGIGEEDKLALVRELAEALGAELGSSRPVVDYGWLSRDRQVGSSGQTVAARLYLAVGISGAIQHQVGMRNCGCIVAVNKDPNAPVFEIADYGIVADLFEIVPRLTEAIKEHRGS